MSSTPIVAAFLPGAKVVYTSDGMRGQVIHCGCPECESGRMVAIDQYPYRAFPAVFPNGRHLRPAHRVVSGVALDERPAVERRATELAVGCDT
jgi:hypothetical protein